jgi:hypothetical protein
MALDPDLVHRYAEARQAYDTASRDKPADDPAVLEARQEFHDALAEYVLDLQINGMSVPDGLEDELAAMGGPPAQ